MGTFQLLLSVNGNQLLLVTASKWLLTIGASKSMKWEMKSNPKKSILEI